MANININDIPALEFHSENNPYPIDKETGIAIINLLNEKSFNSILDLGSGTTTRIFSYYKLNSNNDCEVYTIESSMPCMRRIVDLDNVNKIRLVTHYSEFESYYIGLTQYVEENKLHFDFVSIDGPYSDNVELARKNILKLIQIGAVDENTTILIHDTNRIGEQNLLGKVKELLPNQKEIQLTNAVILTPNQ